MTGLCECGCGQRTTPFAKAGTFARFIHGHNARTKSHKPWTGKNGYLYVDDDQLVHRLIVERVLGHPLRKFAPVHHIDEDPKNNDPSNLVACDSTAYHMLLHKRKRAYEACGDPSARLCTFCGQYDKPAKLRGPLKQPYHIDCQRQYQQSQGENRRRMARLRYHADLEVSRQRQREKRAEKSIRKANGVFDG